MNSTLSMRSIPPTLSSNFQSIFIIRNKIEQNSVCLKFLTFILDRWLVRINPAADQVLSISALLAGIQCTIRTIFDSIGKVFCLSAQKLHRSKCKIVSNDYLIWKPNLNHELFLSSSHWTDQLPRDHSAANSELAASLFVERWHETVNAITDWASKCLMNLSLVHLSVKLFSKIILTSFTKQPYLISITDHIQINIILNSLTGR